MNKLDRNILSNLIGSYGDAFYLFDSEQFISNFKELKQSFASIYPNFNIAYSYKTNYLPRICNIVNSLGGYAEVVSEMELELALRVGVTPAKIIWNGPIKNLDIVKTFLISGGTVNIDSYEEFASIKEFALNSSEHNINIGIRCNFDVGDGVVSRFGFDVDSLEFEQVINEIKGVGNLKLINFHCHFAKRQIEFWPARAQGIIGIVDRLGIIPDRIDIGGGLFGKMPDSLKHQFSSAIPTYQEYANAVASIFADYFRDKDKKPELLIEPGSALVGDCMQFVCTVKTIKNVRGKCFATVMGSQKNISMAGVNPPIEVIAMGEHPQTDYKDVDFVGYTCIEGDVIYRNYNGPLAMEDIIVISNCGSYSIVMKPPFILANFPILDICNDNIVVLKKQEFFDDIFHTYTI